MERRSAILLHPTALPGPFGSGDLGPDAVAWLDRLAAAGQSLWQILPLGPTALGDSPYGALSAFAGNPRLVSPERLAELGLLTSEELERARLPWTPRVDFERSGAHRRDLVRRAFDRFESERGGAQAALADELAAWSSAPEMAAWLDDWTLFAALRERHGREAWTSWPEALRRREPAALNAARSELATEIRFHAFVQFCFARQLAALRSEAARRGIALLGDLPIYVAADAADVWAHPELFEVDAEGRPGLVAGVPPDYFSADGQLWGNPLYRWSVLAESGYAWWIDRIRANLAQVDLLRLDHFRAFQAYWQVEAGAPTARDGHWVDGPGRALFDALGDALGDLPLLAEDLGLITDEVHALRRDLDLPGMKVLQFGFHTGSEDHLPHRVEPATAYYTGTHDNQTARGWFEAANDDERRRALDYLGGTPEEVAWSMVRAVWTSVAETAVAPAQDILGLAADARMNTPGIPGGNWGWRLPESTLDDATVDRLRRLTEVAQRRPAPPAATGDEAGAGSAADPDSALPVEPPRPS
ncbi:MAG: 4-alpha-glucanotransferase [Acidobacteria bacterium]|nr:4-alpha-glucanotransferase [Acidobacteriota bacterium]